MRVLSLRELNRTLLARQLLSERSRRPVVKAVERLVALQAQYAPSPYVALWSRVAGFRKEQLTRNPAIAKAGCLRSTLHVVSRAEFPYIAAAYIESQRGRTEGLGVDIEALQRAVPTGPVSSAELRQLAHRVLGTDDPWTVSFAYRALPFVRTGARGPWPHTKPSPVVLWRDPLPDPQEASARVVLQYLAAYGPASREDIVQFTGFRLRQVNPALEGLRTFEDEEGRTLFDVSRAPIASEEGAAPVRFLPAFDSVILAHRDRSRIVPPEYLEAVFNKRNATTKNTFTVDGFVAGAWRIEKRTLALDPFATLAPRARREVEAEGERLLAFYLA
ncbi:MAG: winged helix DNA-binding domain-containing protein [Actinomycetota bacterium]|nr:winged helix DNA-binding domain-containing protein [Actinomycetota bacterium]